jgi:hypothetical protein
MARDSEDLVGSKKPASAFDLRDEGNHAVWPDDRNASQITAGPFMSNRVITFDKLKSKVGGRENVEIVHAAEDW